MAIGLTKQDIENSLQQNGLGDGEVISSSALRQAIANVIIENNKAIEKQVTEKVSGDLLKGVNKLGGRW
ncbi:hypothetical protein NQZ71_13220 [Niallia taxi]|uniref:hypothetical protein n=1 Tax=Niallia taxi TaxID=2499688 RepID=UPI00293464D8|nr:hypothetical protein [Niallia taxi]WOD61776.1 hypothetical protein NQZ71_13220 [Niallia taxi]